MNKIYKQGILITINIHVYMDGTHGITGVALFRMFYVKP